MTHQLSQPEIGYIDPSRTDADDGTSHISDLNYAAFKSQDDMDAFLLANGYTAAQVALLTTNDKVFAIRSISNPLAPLADPDVTDIIPAGSSVGDEVTLIGTNLAGVTDVTVDAIAAVMGSQTDTYIVITIPAGAAGAADVVVTAPGGTDTIAYVVV